jgi:para-aminobenzoate synthetase/4-amino-4-deoxychorismate lyase
MAPLHSSLAGTWEEFDPENKVRHCGTPGFAVLRENDHWRIYHSPSEIIVADDAQSLHHLLARIESHVAEGGEAAGYFAYEAGYALEPRLLPLLKQRKTVLAWFGLYQQHDILQDREIFPEHSDQCVENATLKISRDDYENKIETIRTLIEAGEVYQINFTDRLAFCLRGTPWELFAALYQEHPTPHAAFLNTGSEQVISLSPELFFRIAGNNIVVQPMKGTAPRGLSLEQDHLRAKELRESEKERAENLMIVDLMRSDLGRLCCTGSVVTRNLFEARRFRSVWQMTSTVEGKLLDQWAFGDVIRALFPAGSVTGAPKIRAMEHIACLEASPRGVYTGAIGYCASGQSQFNVAIRTAIVRGTQGVMGVGSGITYDSLPSAEWQECELKCEFLTRRPPLFNLFETLLWRDGYVFLDQHLARMSASAEYFSFTFDSHQARTKLFDLASGFSPNQSRRVRISLVPDGSIEVAHTALAEQRHHRVRISGHRVCSTDRFLYHKTTNRQIYDAELAAAQETQCDDALFFNERGELTEGAIHNVFLVKNGEWRTPPVACGLLDGIYRQMFLSEHPETLEAVLCLEDLLNADEIFVCNSVRGMYEVKLASGGESS